MRNVCEIKELSNGQDARSIWELRCEQAQPWEADVLTYLRAGRRGAVAPAILTDVISGERIPSVLTMMTDGEYFWRSDLIYYIEKYHLMLDEDFLAKVLHR